MHHGNGSFLAFKESAKWKKKYLCWKALGEAFQIHHNLVLDENMYGTKLLKMMLRKQLVNKRPHKGLGGTVAFLASMFQ